MGSNRMSWLLIFTLSSLFNNLSEAKHEKKLPSAVVVGTVYCDTCFQQDFSKTSHFISGASVAVECKDGNPKPSFYKEVKTNERGVFKVRLPFAVSKHVERIKQCSVKLISSSEPFCAVASSATSSLLHLKSRKEGTHIFSAGFFTFKPLKQPELCNQKPTFATSKEFSSSKAIPSLDTPTSPFPPVPPTIPNLPTLPTLPTIPQLPVTLPNLPPLPNLGRPPNVPIQPNSIYLSKKSPSLDKKQVSGPIFSPMSPIPILPTPPPLIAIPPNQLQPPPLVPNPFQSPPLVPNPFQPTPPSVLPPIIPQPPPATIFPPFIPSPFLPPNPGLTPPSPPRFRFPFPSITFPPFPIFPGTPPAPPSKRTSP